MLRRLKSVLRDAVICQHTIQLVDSLLSDWDAELCPELTLSPVRNDEVYRAFLHSLLRLAVCKAFGASPPLIQRARRLTKHWTRGILVPRSCPFSRARIFAWLVSGFRLVGCALCVLLLRALLKAAPPPRTGNPRAHRVRSRLASRR